MIKVTIYKTKRNAYYGFDVKGHAEFLEEGRDIVCAAASVLIINTINAIERFTDEETTVVQDEEEASIEFRFPDHAGKEAHLLLDAMVLGLETIEEDNINGHQTSQFNAYIDIIFEEV